jgi:hypothetical protein
MQVKGDEVEDWRKQYGEPGAENPSLLRCRFAAELESLQVVYVVAVDV